MCAGTKIPKKKFIAKSVVINFTMLLCVFLVVSISKMENNLKFSQDFWKIHFDNYQINGLCLKKLSDTGYFSDDPNVHVLYGDIGKRFFLKNEHFFKPLNTTLFKSFANKNRYPIIMNFIEGEYHLRFKKDLDNYILNNYIKSFNDYLSIEIPNFWDKLKKTSSRIDLFDEIIEYVIKQQFLFFFNYTLNKEELHHLSLYEDYFTFGLYLDKLADLEKYYSFNEFQKAKNKYDLLFHHFIKDNQPSIFSEFHDSMIAKNYEYNYVFSQFYNISIAGSTNIAKSFIYLLCFCEDAKLNDTIFNSDLSDLETYILSGKLLAELYRLLPYVYNQVVPPFIIREASEDFNLNDEIKVKKGDKIYYYHLLQNISHIIDSPLEFNPFRPDNNYKGKSSPVFGAGLHRCCGASLTDTWLHHLLVGYLKSGITLKSENGLQHTTYNPDFEEIKKVIYLVKA